MIIFHDSPFIIVVDNCDQVIDVIVVIIFLVGYFPLLQILIISHHCSTHLEQN